MVLIKTIRMPLNNVRNCANKLKVCRLPHHHGHTVNDLQKYRATWRALNIFSHSKKSSLDFISEGVYLFNASVQLGL